MWTGECPLQQANLYNDPMIVEGRLMVEESCGLEDGATAVLGRPWLGPWKGMSRIQQPHPARLRSIPRRRIDPT